MMSPKGDKTKTEEEKDINWKEILIHDIESLHDPKLLSSPKAMKNLFRAVPTSTRSLDFTKVKSDKKDVKTSSNKPQTARLPSHILGLHRATMIYNNENVQRTKTRKKKEVKTRAPTPLPSNPSTGDAEKNEQEKKDEGSQTIVKNETTNDGHVDNIKTLENKL